MQYFSNLQARTVHQNNSCAIARTVNFQCLFDKRIMAVCLDSPDLSFIYAYSYAIWRKQIH